MADHYDTLGVTRQATGEEIRDAYKAGCANWHPDRPDGDAQRFQAIRDAYETLRDPVRRARYDAELAGAGDPIAVLDRILGRRLEDVVADLARLIIVNVRRR